MDTPVTVGILMTFVVASAATFDPLNPWGQEIWFDSLTIFVLFFSVDATCSAKRLIAPRKRSTA